MEMLREERRVPMGRKIKVLDRDNFVDAINDYCSHKITMDEAAKKMGVCTPTFRKYLRMVWMGEPLPEELFERKK
jgi:hypothetical protein